MELDYRASSAATRGPHSGWAGGRRCRTAMLRAAPALLRPMARSPPSGPAQPAVPSRAYYYRRQIMHSRLWRSIQSGLPSRPSLSELVKQAILAEADSTCRNSSIAMGWMCCCGREAELLASGDAASGGASQRSRARTARSDSSGLTRDEIRRWSGKPNQM